MESVKSSCKQPENVKIVTLDLEKLDTLEAKMNEAIQAFGTVDILVNNGGISQRSLAAETSLDVDKRIMNINYLGTVALTKYLIPYFPITEIRTFCCHDKYCG